MRIVSLKDLKENLAEIAECASKGEHVSVTKYNKPYIALVPVHSLNLRLGKNLGTPLDCFGSKSSKGKFLDILLEDRYGEE